MSSTSLIAAARLEAAREEQWVVFVGQSESLLLGKPEPAGVGVVFGVTSGSLGPAIRPRTAGPYASVQQVLGVIHALSAIAW